MTKTATRDKLSIQSERIIEALVVKRGVDDIGINDKWSEERLESCTDDFTYDLAVEVRKLRVDKAMAWWRIAQELDLPGNGVSAKQGRAGAAWARRLWRAAYGQTYSDTNVDRETKDERKDRYVGLTAKPYFDAEELDTNIINTIRGAKITWVTRLAAGNGLVHSMQETFVHDDLRMIHVKLGPKGRYVEFFEQPDEAQLSVDPNKAIAKGGPLRSVYLDRITKVGR